MLLMPILDDDDETRIWETRLGSDTLWFGSFDTYGFGWRWSRRFWEISQREIKRSWTDSLECMWGTCITFPQRQSLVFMSKCWWKCCAGQRCSSEGCAWRDSNNKVVGGIQTVVQFYIFLDICIRILYRNLSYSIRYEMHARSISFFPALAAQRLLRSVTCSTGLIRAYKVNRETARAWKCDISDSKERNGRNLIRFQVSCCCCCCSSTIVKDLYSVECCCCLMLMYSNTLY